MTAQDYLISELEKLKQPMGQATSDKLEDSVLKLVLSKKFRKYSLAPEVLEHITNSIVNNIKTNQPIKFTLPFGAYKLWRLDETPEVDWAELFTMIYFTKWLKPVCEIYKPGVWFDFFSDDVIIPRMNNIPVNDVAKYRQGFEVLLNFIKDYQPSNYKMTLTRVIDQYDSQEQFEKEFQGHVERLKSELEDSLPKLDDAQKATIELNVKATPEQKRDPKWREKVQLIHDSYSGMSRRRPYYRPPEQNKIMVVTTPLWGMLTPGSTKDSTMKFWVGAGVLRPRDDAFRQVILSPSQLEQIKFHWEDVDIDLPGKNCNKIRILD